MLLANQIFQAIAMIFVGSSAGMSLWVSARLGDDNAIFISICGIVTIVVVSRIELHVGI